MFFNEFLMASEITVTTPIFYTWVLKHIYVPVIIALIASALWAWWFYKKKPNLEIYDLKLDETKSKKQFLKVDVKNISSEDAFNINIEICVVAGSCTYHFKIDRNYFLILPKMNNKDGDDSHRTFKAINLDEMTIDTYWGKDKYDWNSFIKSYIKNKSNFIRVRVYAIHGYSGFGKAFQTKFKYNGNQFKKIN